MNDVPISERKEIMKYLDADLEKNINTYISYLCKNSSKEKPLWNQEVLRGLKKVGWNYIDGCMFNGLMSLYLENKDANLLKYIDEYISSFVEDSGHIKLYYYNNYNECSEEGFDSDPLNEGKILFPLYFLTKKEKYRKAIDYLHLQIERLPRIQGNFWHKEKYPNQIWLDGIYMLQPFYAMYEYYFNHERNMHDIVFQLENAFYLTYDKRSSLLMHGYDGNYLDPKEKMIWSKAHNGQSKIAWLRAMGWYEMALVDVYEYIKDVRLQNKLKELLKKTIDSLLKYKVKNVDMFYQVIDKKRKKGNYLESSGSLMIAYAILKGCRLDMLTKRYQEIGLRIFRGVLKQYFFEDEAHEFHLGGICIGAGLSASKTDKKVGTYKMYISRRIVLDDGKAIGPLMMALSEIHKMEKEEHE